MSATGEYRALHDAAGFLERRDRGRLRLTGEDRRSYLQGLLTNDILALAPGTGCYAAMLTAQGRMITDMRVLELGDAVLIDLPAALDGTIDEHFNRFIFTEDVSVTLVTQSLSQIGVYGPRASDVLSAAFARLHAAGESSPEAGRLASLEPFESRRWDVGGTAGIVAGSDDFGLEGFELFVESTASAAVVAALEGAGAVPVGDEAVETVRIESGRPEFGKDMDESTIPLEAGIEDRAISQTKGCYVGQEIVIRVLHRGHGRVARRLVGFVLDGDAPSRGDRVHSGDRDIGVITSAAVSPALGRPVALGYVHRDFTQPGTAVTIGSGGDGRAAVVAGLPFVRRQVEPARA